jgi:hypothetical protein
MFIPSRPPTGDIGCLGKVFWYGLIAMRVFGIVITILYGIQLLFHL